MSILYNEAINKIHPLICNRIGCNFDSLYTCNICKQNTCGHHIKKVATNYYICYNCQDDPSKEAQVFGIIKFYNTETSFIKYKKKFLKFISLDWICRNNEQY